MSAAAPLVACPSVPPCPLRSGVHVWWWPKFGPTKFDVGKAIAEAVALGVAGVIAQNGTSTGWIAPHVPAIQAAGLQVTLGLGMDGGHQDAIVAAINSTLDASLACMLDWESPKLWENTSGNALAHAIVDGVLAAHSDAPERVVDCPWWAPINTSDGHGTHPRAPTTTFGTLAQTARFPQCYGAGTRGLSARMLAWARSASQYPKLGTPADRVRPAVEAYGRDTIDHVALLTAEPIVCLWDWLEMDDACRTSLRAVAKLAALGFGGPDAVRAFQAAHGGLTTDNLCGPATLAALGL